MLTTFLCKITVNKRSRLCPLCLTIIPLSILALPFSGGGSDHSNSLPHLIIPPSHVSLQPSQPFQPGLSLVEAQCRPCLSLVGLDVVLLHVLQDLVRHLRSNQHTDTSPLSEPTHAQQADHRYIHKKMLTSSSTFCARMGNSSLVRLRSHKQNKKQRYN